jgi:hypothetical protein
VRVKARVPAGVAPRFEKFAVNGRDGGSGNGASAPDGDASAHE